MWIKCLTEGQKWDGIMTCGKKSPRMSKNILDSMRKRERFKRITKNSKLDNDWMQYTT